MSPASVSNFVGDLVAMATAFERLPQVEAELEQAKRAHEIDGDTIARLELKLLDRANEISDLHSRIRSLEVERDDAQFHALEADDRTQRALDFIKATFGNAGTLIQALEPPAKSATPDVSVQAMPEAAGEGEAQGVSVLTHPTTATTPSYSSTGTDAPTDASSAASTSIEVQASAPEVAPASPLPDAPADTHSPNAPTESNSAPATAIGSEPPSPAPFSAPPIDRGKYHGLSYSEAHAKEGLGFSWPSKDEWLSNGGSLDQFYA